MHRSRSGGRFIASMMYKRCGAREDSFIGFRAQEWSRMAVLARGRIGGAMRSGENSVFVSCEGAVPMLPCPGEAEERKERNKEQERENSPHKHQSLSDHYAVAVGPEGGPAFVSRRAVGASTMVRNGSRASAIARVERRQRYSV